MKRCWGLLGLLALSCLPAMAQDLTKYEFAAAYEFRSYNVPFTSRLSLDGWGATINRNWTPRVSIIGDFTGTYRFQGSNGDTSLYSFAAGPRVYPFRRPKKLEVYVQGLVGGAYLRTSFPAQNGFLATSVSSFAFSFSGGGGVEVKIKPRISIRLIEGDYEQTRFNANYVPPTSTTAVPHQNNYRISAGVIFRFGEK